MEWTKTNELNKVQQFYSIVKEEERRKWEKKRKNE